MENISEDILSEILSRLPANSLIRFKCVSKRWYSLISSPSFIKLHLNHLVTTKMDSATSSHKIVEILPARSIDYEAFDRADSDSEDAREAIRFLSFPIYVPEEESDVAEIVGSCNGLICLSLLADFTLWNPCTGKSRRLPSPGLFRCEEIYFSGFGYDVVSDDYKILFGTKCFYFSEFISRCKVFSLKSNSWRDISHELAEKARFAGVYFNGALHWCEIHRGNGHNSVLSFDLADEKFKNEIPTPKVYFEHLGVHQGQLFIYSFVRWSQFQAWISKEDGNGKLSWIKWVDVSNDGLPWCRYYIKLIACTKSGKLVCQVDDRLMILSNPKDQTFKKIPVQLNDHYQPVTTYIESLISPFD